jgi:hypothetical protein
MNSPVLRASALLKTAFCLGLAAVTTVPQIGEAAVPPSAPAAAPAAPGMAPSGPPLDTSGLGKRKPVRVRMELEMKTTTDVNENHLPFSDNTEDEVYYSLAGVKKIKGQTTTLLRKEVRPNNPSRDVWEMGPNSNDRLHRSLFEASMNHADSAALTLVLSEQDNAQLKMIEDIIKHAIEGAITYLAQEVGASGFLGTGKFDDKKALDTLFADTRALVLALVDRQDQPLGVVSIVLAGNKLEVKPSGGDTGLARVISRTDDSADVELTAFGSKYRLRLYREVGDLPAPKHRVFLDRSKDQCGEDKLWVQSKTGDVLIRKGETRDVYVKTDHYTWHCGSKSEIDRSNAPDATNLAVTTRAPSGREISWEWFTEATAVADYK